ncbi:MAG: hypothetical protein EB060_09565 [Proteobacteria bacterium]|nr:hypothetical protein [Pseudomonadota bacterium]
MSPQRRKRKLLRWLNKRGWLTGRERYLLGLQKHEFGALWKHWFDADVIYRADRKERLPIWLKLYTF